MCARSARKCVPQPQCGAPLMPLRRVGGPEWSRLVRRRQDCAWGQVVDLAATAKEARRARPADQAAALRMVLFGAAGRGSAHLMAVALFPQCQGTEDTFWRRTWECPRWRAERSGADSPCVRAPSRLSGSSPTLGAGRSAGGSACPVPPPPPLRLGSWGRRRYTDGSVTDGGEPCWRLAPGPLSWLRRQDVSCAL